MWKTIWKCFKMPIVAVVTGKYQGHLVSRNPFSWLGMMLWGIVLIPYTILVYPFVLLWMSIGLGMYVEKGNHAEITDRGINVTTSKGELVSRHEWADIAEVTMEFEPPSFYPSLHLLDGRLVHLHCASVKNIINVCKGEGIKVDERFLDG